MVYVCPYLYQLGQGVGAVIGDGHGKGRQLILVEHLQVCADLKYGGKFIRVSLSTSCPHKLTPTQIFGHYYTVCSSPSSAL